MSASLFRILRIDSITNRIFHNNFRVGIPINTRKLHNASTVLNPRKVSNHKSDDAEKAKDVPLSYAMKYKVFDDSDSKIIVDTLDENHKNQGEIFFDEFEGINLNRGLSGVFEIEELVEILQRENAKDIFVAAVPAKCRFVEHMCIVTGRGPRHMLAIAEFIRRVFKKKCHKTDKIPFIEGKASKDWIALDLGNIALHIFSNKTRIYYDLDQLWSVGPEFDSLSNVPDDDLLKLLDKHSKVFLSDLKPVND